MGRKWNPHTLPVGMENCATPLENSLAVPQKVKQRVTIPPSNSTPGYLPKRNADIRLHRNLYMDVRMFIAALLIIAQNWRQPKCPPTDEWINKADLSIH